jgi:ribosomal protein S18 acetylase RimI-like enzyme
LTRYRFDLAGPADDADLRRVLAATPMAGTIALTFLREPSYFAGARVEGRFRQVVACRDRENGRIVGFGVRSVSPRYVNGRPERIGYLSTLRLLKEHRNRGLAARGYAMFRRLHTDGQTPLYVTTIAESNYPALTLLTSGRPGLPTYHDAGRFHTAALPLTRRRVRRPLPIGLEVRPARREDMGALLTFLREHGPRRQFFPVYEEEDFVGENGAFKDLRLEDVLLAFRGGALVGTLAGWDQQGFRQTVVHGYVGVLGWVRPAYNVWARLRGRPPLPAPGGIVSYLTAALSVVAGDDPAVFAALLAVLRARAAAGTHQYLMLGLHETDPLLPVVRACRATWYDTRLYLVCWDDGEPTRGGLDGRPPYLELGCL